ncbi:MAG TPA: CBS domain-containing protein [Gammaproteobacteria bacterium]
MSIPLRVRDFMTTELVTVSPYTEITQVVQILIANDISGVLVVDDSGALAGILTERDCISVASSAGYYDEWGGPVSNFMTTAVETVAPDDNLVDIAVKMTSSPHRRFPVLEEGKLVGLISRRDVLRALGGGSWFTKKG